MCKPIHLTTLFLVVFISFCGHAQDRALDSLQHILRNPKIHDTTKLSSIAVTLDGYSSNDTTNIYLSKMMGNLALKNFKKKGNTRLLNDTYARYLGAYYNNISVYYAKKRDVANTLKTIDQSIAYFKYAKADPELNYVMISKSVFLGRINQYDKAISNLFVALNYFEKDKKANAAEIAYVHASFAKIYSDFKKYDQAIVYNNKVIAFFDAKAKPLPEDIQTSAIAYANLGYCHLELKKYAAAMTYFKKSLPLYDQIGDINNKSATLCKMAVVEMELSNFDAAEQYLRQALSPDLNPVYESNVNIKFGMLYNRRKDFAKADIYLSKGLALAKENQALDMQEQASELLFDVSKKNGNFKKALEMHEFHDKLVDSTKAEASKNLLAQQELKYDFERKELNYKLTSEKETAAKNNWLIGLSAVLLLLVSGGYFYYRNNKQRQAISVLEKNQIKQKLLITQMNPHFIFNSIQNIRSLIYNKQDTEAVDYLNKFAKLTRQILENSTESYISLDEEIEMITNYVSIQQLLYNNSFNYKIDVDDKIDVESVFLPPMLTQPFIENAIKHGLGENAKNGMINIRFYLDETKLYFEVTDNGIGFGDLKQQSDHKSMAMSITQERLANYTKNREFKVETSNVLSDQQNILGAKVSFEIPYIYEN